MKYELNQAAELSDLRISELRLIKNPSEDEHIKSLEKTDSENIRSLEDTVEKMDRDYRPVSHRTEYTKQRKPLTMTYATPGSLGSSVLGVFIPSENMIKLNSNMYSNTEMLVRSHELWHFRGIVSEKTTDFYSTHETALSLAV